MVGTSGASGLRVRLLTPSGVTCFAASSGRAVTASTKAISTSPAISACTAGAPPR